MTLSQSNINIARYTLAFLWLLTAWTSVFGDYQFGVETLNQAGITGSFADFLILGGAATDLLIGLWVLSGKARLWNYRIQILTIVTYSLLLTVIAPEFWLHPFGPLSKNLPILALLLLLQASEVERNTV